MMLRQDGESPIPLLNVVINKVIICNILQGNILENRDFVDKNQNHLGIPHCGLL